MDDFQSHLRTLAIQFPPFMIAIVFHEFAHGFVANLWGDSTAKDSGRMTLNPIPHVDLMGTIILPIASMATGFPVLFGWANPVPISPSRFRKYRPGLFWVSFAGPGMNFLLGFVSALLLGAVVRFVPHDHSLFEPLVAMGHASVFLNFILGMFNLLPLPPLDGSKVIESFLSYDATKKYEQMARWSFPIIIVLIVTGAIRILLFPGIMMGALVLRFSEMIFGVGLPGLGV